MKIFTAGAMLFATGAVAMAQDASSLPSAPMPSMSVSKLPYGVERGSSGPLSLTLDDAIARGSAQNLQVKLATQNERTVHGTILTVGNALLPNMEIVGKTSTQQVNLAAMGFKPASLAGLLPPGVTFPTIVKVDTTSLS